MARDKNDNDMIGSLLDLFSKRILPDLIDQAAGAIDGAVSGLIDRVKDELEDAPPRPSRPIDTFEADLEGLVEEQETQVFRVRVEKILGSLEFFREPVWGTLPAGKLSSWRLNLHEDKQYGIRLYLQVSHYRADANDGTWSWGHSRKQYLSQHMTDSEILRQAFALLDGYQHHEVREGFRYKGKAIFGPHISAEALLEVADRLDVRSG